MSTTPGPGVAGSGTSANALGAFEAGIVLPTLAKSSGTLAEPKTKRPFPPSAIASSVMSPIGSARDRKSVVQGKSVSVRVDLGGRRIIKKKTIAALPCTDTIANTNSLDNRQL